MTGTTNTSNTADAGNNRIVLLFCHGCSFTKETWGPVIQWLQESPLLKQTPCDVVTFDWRYHGVNHDHSEPAKLSFRDGNKRSPRVQHTARQWTEWAHPDLLRKIQTIRRNDNESTGSGSRTRIVGVGHSMGATVLLQIETLYPGTLDGYIGFEPIYESGALTKPQVEGARDLLVSVAMARAGEWPTWEAVVQYHKTTKTFARWHPEVLDAYLTSAIFKASDGSYKLAMTPLQEASTYAHTFLKFPAETLACAQCPLFIEHSQRTFFFHVEPARELAEKLPGKYILGEAIRNTSHCMVQEDPDTCAQRILHNLEQLPIFQ